MTNLESNQHIMGKKHSKYENTKLMEIMKNDAAFRDTIIEICVHFDENGDSTMIHNLFTATFEDNTFSEFLINCDYQLRVLGEKYLKWIGAI